jgi:bifunctional DNase/RNase
MDPILPAKIKKYLKTQIEQALDENFKHQEKGYTIETVKKIRLAFFNSIVDLF